MDDQGPPGTIAGEGGAAPRCWATKLFSAIQEFRQRPKSGRVPEELAIELMDIRHACDLLELEFAEVAAGFAATDEYDRQGSVTPIEWIRHNCQMSGATAADRVCVGRQLGNLPQSADAVGRGTIGFAHLSLIARTVDALSDPATGKTFDESSLLDQARQNSVGRLWHFCHHVRHAHDHEGFEAEQREAVEMRRLRLSPCEDGSITVGGWLDSAGGAALRTALEPLARRSGDADDRCRERRLADALVELATHSLDAGLVPQTAGQRPHLQVTATLQTLRGLVGSPAAEMEFSLPISARTAQRFACDSSITRVLLGSESAVIDVGRARRVVSGSTRRALNTRDRHCQWPGCDRPASWSAAHHLVHWAHGGATDLSNLILLCHRHHWMVHEGGWRLARAADGRLLAIPSEAGLFPSARAPDAAAA